MKSSITGSLPLDLLGLYGCALPRYPRACGVCLERGHPQHFTVTKKFFDILGVAAPPVLDGILLGVQQVDCLSCDAPLRYLVDSSILKMLEHKQDTLPKL